MIVGENDTFTVLSTLHSTPHNQSYSNFNFNYKYVSRL